MSAPPILLHATPPLEPLPASDAESLYFASLFQLACPGRWALTTGEWGVNGGKLPYITHLGHQLRPTHLSSIPSFYDPDSLLSQEGRVDALCWKAYIEQNLVDLVNHTFFSLPPNYPETLAKVQFRDLTFPKNQYIPQRLRSIVRSRLQHAGLWGLGGLNDGDAADEDRKKLEEAFVVGPAGTLAPRAWSGWRAGRDMENRRRQWGEQELEKRVKGVLDPLVRRLGEEPYFFGDRPTTLDLALFAQLTFVLSPTLPNPLLPNLLRSSYPTLIAHHDRLSSVLFPHSSWSAIPCAPRPPKPEPTYLETIQSWWQPESSPKPNGEKKKEGKTPKEKQFERGRWLWFAGATVAMISYVLASGMVQIDFSGEDDDWIDAEDDEDEDEEDEEEPEEVVVVVEDEEEVDE
ncbi:hypothetical protein CI109_101444 [Kwoniella shandongensis]|uniref:Uncharacterized protein n=1 Tax=Kwoniella shandongensis TaxID=1734106 RepID=A0A5M6BUZ2_9TREE|nr:uncharacterized protein CI109_005139 [Kwoniella shandongensis]KAA5526563.1 hypothetical protein CI109_005139 [Kwoniella shandongensis]